MSEKGLTNNQKMRKEKLIREFEQRIAQIPEKQEGGNVLDGGGGRFHKLGLEYQARLKKIMEEP